ncbi:MAG: hypothetical protein ACK5GN_02995 [Pseudomonadota bacterium]|jgi:hypothetical protein
MDITTLQPGDAVELLVDANAIPAGCYSFLEIHGEMSVFTVGDEVIIGLATDFWTKFMRPAAESGAPLSSEREFARRYGELYSQLNKKRVPTDPSRLTFCMLSSRVLKKCGPGFNSRAKKAMSASELLH